MISEPPQTPLISFIKANHPVYYGKICELREIIEGWLAYIPHTFPHYTRHTIQHSDEIVLQISNLLFTDENRTQPIVRLSGVESYILVASAYLHDAGMVTADKEKIDIIQSIEWKDWTTGQGGGAKRWVEIKKLRQGLENVPGEGLVDDAKRNFLADLQTRFLIAEFIRARHHIRASDLIRLHHEQLGRFDFGDHMLQQAVANTCMAHGLRQHELEDNDLFPDQRDIRGEKANLRFMAILLRLGDLLDMSVDRACPLLLNAASPLPADSPAHWSQYQRLFHRSIGIDRIEIKANCQTQDEHRVLQDWCQWIVDEVQNAKIVMPKTRRHNGWPVPDASLIGINPTIEIRPVPTATYVPSNWTLKFDQEAIFDRLIRDLYDSPLTFIRELIQNALDATRCQVYLDLYNQDSEIPEFPTQINADHRYRYPVTITLTERETKNALSEQTERRQVLIIEDLGIGMDKDIIEKYFLQIGRSYYSSEEFRRRYRFIPASRFGIGFLSVFASSDRVTVETYKPSSLDQEQGAIKLTLTGLRNYLLRERSDRQYSGTRIEVHLRESIKQGEVTNLVRNWCRRVEFPIVVDDLGNKTTIVAERPEEFVYEEPLITNKEAVFAVRAFPINRPGIEGELYVFAAIDDRGESWGTWGWAQHYYPQMHPLAFKPKFPDNLICLHGIAIHEKPHSSTGPQAARLDYRNNKLTPTLSRDIARRKSDPETGMDPELESRWEEILREHLATSRWGSSTDSWWYKQILVKHFPLPLFWASMPGTIRIFTDGVTSLISLNELLVIPTITVVMNVGDEYTHVSDRKEDNEDDEDEVKKENPAWDTDIPAISNTDFPKISSTHRKAILLNRSVSHVRWLSSGHLALDWKIRAVEDQWFYYADPLHPIILAELPLPAVVGASIHLVTEYGSEGTLLNINNPVVQWVIQVKDACYKNLYNLNQDQFHQLISKLHNVIDYRGDEYWFRHLVHFVNKWREIPNLPAELYPPNIHLNPDMFILRPQM